MIYEEENEYIKVSLLSFKGNLYIGELKINLSINYYK